ncbi:S-adenosyl-L-methionine-dependent methyltransferase [Daedalea quercina L-15889]|uniref:S-adenosyl-L-methionine-dependent methyltransferase n=1 Tax=Daedalea quercina L-15889 TaxID=1314783 RepID=A0A165LIV6_9APHY|nr:S-adenosyl-L-methionine-dependent methyltransferase [Daedalea quercina L-15889]
MHVVALLHDDDSHYFQSYGENGALRPPSRTRRTQQSLPRRVVLDVSCGTRILSLFAVRAGMQRVIAVDTSPIAEKAQQIVKDNGLENVITVMRMHVEDMMLPDGIEPGDVDVIISEWMGYVLLYTVRI